MIIIDNIQPAFTKIHIIHSGNRICRQYRDPHAGKHFWQIMINQGIILVRAGCQYDRIGVVSFHLVHYLLPSFFQFLLKGKLCLISCFNGFQTDGRINFKCIFHINRQLPVPVFGPVPVEQRCIIGNVPAFFRIV